MPNWALLTARNLPRTTAAMLELDWLHRTRNGIGPVLRGEMRWVAADANRCEYARATAEADLRRSGVDESRIAALKGGPDRWPPEDRAALRFASRMTLDAGAVTDEEVLALRRHYGDEKLVAMVLLLAAANFQDRLLLTLGIPLEDGGPLAPVEVHFSREPPAPHVPPRSHPEELNGPPVPTMVDDPEWIKLGFEILQTNLDLQRSNDGRIRVPAFEEVLAKIPPDAPKPKAPIRIQWSLVCMGYQPELAAAWSTCTRNFGEEAKQDRVFEESLFWVVTRTIHCFY
ncbi:carboxymuconolactone decarboxylase family protein [Tundrisphaera lichenicola]|uniref:carboxymuconolactone decarboxylase family protein n=1 Tax=Tundrisphaera lichenicola TaxID=2029860 RepID=UPI003EBB96DC